MIDDNTIRDMFGSTICDFFFFFSPFFNILRRVKLIHRFFEMQTKCLKIEQRFFRRDHSIILSLVTSSV